MKIKKITYFVLMFLPLLPERIPVSFGFDGRISRWGSKYEALIFPANAIIFGVFMLAMAKTAAKQESSGKSSEKSVIAAGTVSLVFFCSMTAYFLHTAFHRIRTSPPFRCSTCGCAAAFWAPP